MHLSQLHGTVSNAASLNKLTKIFHKYKMTQYQIVLDRWQHHTYLAFLAPCHRHRLLLSI